jgi:hypothetical protein
MQLLHHAHIHLLLLSWKRLWVPSSQRMCRVSLHLSITSGIDLVALYVQLTDTVAFGGGGRVLLELFPPAGAAGGFPAEELEPPAGGGGGGGGFAAEELEPPAGGDAGQSLTFTMSIMLPALQWSPMSHLKKTSPLRTALNV